MNRPGVLCHLTKEKLIDVQQGFVDTFNWMVDFINNIQGDKGIEVDKSMSDHPIIKLSEDADGVTEIGVQGNDGTSATLKKGALIFDTDENSNVKVSVEQSGDDVKVKIGVYYK